MISKRSGIGRGVETEPGQSVALESGRSPPRRVGVVVVAVRRHVVDRRPFGHEHLAALGAALASGQPRRRLAGRRAVAARAAAHRQDPARVQFVGERQVAALARHHHHAPARLVVDVERRRMPLGQQSHHVSMAVAARPHLLRERLTQTHITH